ncbi:MAG: helix-turn-helix transcriptional regulator [Planctomycetaceae bacterium]|nr:helix-turn-helix transcriptional regulator [Planctomycetaceae bacterium]
MSRRFIRENSAGPISVADVAAATTLGQRALRGRFRKELGRSILQEIHAVRIDRAQELLAQTALPVYEVARRCGFSEARCLDRTFLKLTGQRPLQYRRQCQQTLQG